MSAQPVLCPACAAPMRCMVWVANVFKCDKCGFGTCLGSEVAAIDRRVKQRVDVELAEVRACAKTMQHARRGLYEELGARASEKRVDSAHCPACGIVLTRAPKSRWLDCAACGDRISAEWEGKYTAELGRLRRLVVEAVKLSTAAAQVDAVEQALENIHEQRREV